MGGMKRRHFLLLTIPAVAAASPSNPLAKKPKKEEVAIGPVEDLMREHGILRRVMLVYDEAIRRMRAGEKFDPQPVSRAAKLVQEFVEDYHEKNEEQFLFPRFEQKEVLPELVSTLRAQHQEGRRLTQQILHQQRLLPSLEQYNRMYRAHAAREDTVLYPALYQIISHRELEQMGDRFEDIEHSLPLDFEKARDEIASIEKAYDIADLAKYTPV
jgi:hemerythrin-like domain-containing protein